MKKLFLILFALMMVGCSSPKPVNTHLKLSSKEVVYYVDSCLGYVRITNGYFPINCETRDGELWITSELSQQISIQTLQEQVVIAEKRAAEADMSDRIYHAFFFW